MRYSHTALRRTAIALGVAAALSALVPQGAAAAAPPAHPDLDHAGSGLARLGLHAAPLAPSSRGRLRGLDVSSWQGNVNWSQVKAQGASFAYVKATEGTGYVNPYFTQQYVGSYQAGLIRGAYHFGLPDVSSGAAQADYFTSNGGAWSRDGRTLPPMLDIEYNPYGAECYNQTQAGMRSWLLDFSNEVHARTTRYPTIYTTFDWWNTCTGNWNGLGATNPLFIAYWSTSPGPIPAGWSSWTFWQYSDHGTFPGDQDYFNGGLTRLQALVNA